MDPYWAAGRLSLYLGDCREVLPALGATFDACVADPPYGETSLRWDRWPSGWPEVVAERTSSLWCFGSMRMFTRRWAEFAGWRMSQDVVWEKQNGTGCAADRFRRVHEHAVHLYRGRWRDIHHQAPRVPAARLVATARARESRVGHWGRIGASAYVDDGTRLARSVIRARNTHRRAAHHCGKPVELVDLMVRYAVPEGGTVVEPFAGSAPALRAAARSGRGGVGVEGDEAQAERAAALLSTLDATEGWR